MSFTRGNHRRDGRDKELPISTPVKAGSCEEPGGGLPFLSGDSENKISKGLEVPANDISVENQERIFFDGPGGPW